MRKAGATDRIQDAESAAQAGNAATQEVSDACRRVPDSTHTDQGRASGRPAKKDGDSSGAQKKQHGGVEAGQNGKDMPGGEVAAIVTTANVNGGASVRSGATAGAAAAHGLGLQYDSEDESDQSED